jgi:hypothetical protein
MDNLVRAYTDEQLVTIEHYLEQAAAATAESVSELASDNPPTGSTAQSRASR